MNFLTQIKLLPQICFFSLLPCESSHFQTPNSTEMLGSLSFLSGPSKKIQSQLPFQMEIQSRHSFSLKKLQRRTVRGEAICQGLRSVNNAEQTALCSLPCAALPCAPILPSLEPWGPAAQVGMKESWAGGGFLTSGKLEGMDLWEQTEPELMGIAGT